jgi:hypothetical protein
MHNVNICEHISRNWVNEIFSYKSISVSKMRQDTLLTTDTYVKIFYKSSCNAFYLAGNLDKNV